MLLTIYILFIKFAACTMMKRSDIHENFPDYSLRYKYPELCNTDSKQVSGYFELPDGKNFFFWFFESLSEPLEDPLLLWLNGGPGCSSMLGLFMGTGPCQVNNQGDGLINNPHSWTNSANIIYLDQPIKSGYSFHSNKTASVVNSNAASDDVYIFLQLFLKEFSYLKNSDFHIAGESYAGHFIPAIATTIYKNNAKKTFPQIQLKSIMIGNGLTDPLTQYQYYKDMACEPSSYGTLISSQKVCQDLDSYQNECQNYIKKCYNQTDFSVPTTDTSITTCILAAQICNTLVVKTVMDLTNSINTYDVRRPCEDGPLCYDYSKLIKSYLNRSDVKNALGVQSSIDFEICSSDVNADFQQSGDWMRPYVHQLTPLLDSNISVLAYAGDADFICNWMGIRAWTMNLRWHGQEEYNRQKDTYWYINDQSASIAAGMIRKSGSLTFLRLFDSGHMAPWDQPQAALSMFSEWITGAL